MTSSAQLLRRLIRENLTSLDEKKQYEYGSTGYINELDSLIDDIRSLKNSMRKGPNRLKHRKEMHRLQDAIGAIKYLKNVARREGIKSGLLSEGGLKIPRDRRIPLTPSVVSEAVLLYEDFISQFNNFLDSKGLSPVVAKRPVGSVSYYQRDIIDRPESEYGDIDYLVEFPSPEGARDIGDIRSGQRNIVKRYTSELVEFLRSYAPDYVDVGLTLAGARPTPMMVILRLPDGNLVQVDTIVTHSRYVGWMEGRYTPERGIKGYILGNLYKALGDYFKISVGTEGVLVRMRGGQRVSSRTRKGVEFEQVSTDIRNFLVDIARYVSGNNDIQITPLLSQNPGVDPARVTVSGLGKGIRGLAETLAQEGVIDSSTSMLADILERFRLGLIENVDRKARPIGGEIRTSQEYIDKMMALNDREYNKIKIEFGL